MEHTQNDYKNGKKNKIKINENRRRSCVRLGHACNLKLKIHHFSHTKQNQKYDAANFCFFFLNQYVIASFGIVVATTLLLDGVRKNTFYIERFPL